MAMTTAPGLVTGPMQEAAHDTTAFASCPASLVFFSLQVFPALLSRQRNLCSFKRVYYSFLLMFSVLRPALKGSMHSPISASIL